MKTLISLMLALAFAVPAMANSVVYPKQIQVKNVGTVPYEFLFEDTSTEGESLDAFMLRVGKQLYTYSQKTGFEACGLIAKQGERYGVVIGSNHSQLSCVLVNATPAGMKAMSQSIHSHPPSDAVALNEIDRMFLRLPNTALRYTTDADDFSEMDGAGYLVSTQTGKLIRQFKPGARSSRTVGSVIP